LAASIAAMISGATTATLSLQKFMQEFSRLCVQGK
jgi:hypothetical protein